MKTLHFPRAWLQLLALLAMCTQGACGGSDGEPATGTGSSTDTNSSTGGSANNPTSSDTTTTSSADGGQSNASAGGASSTVTGTDGGGAASTADSGGGASNTTTGAGGGPGPLPEESDNPVYRLLATYENWLSTAASDADKLVEDQQLADNIITWQLPHGGFYKNDFSQYAAPWNGSAARSGWTGEEGVELGTIDNEATVTELMFLANVYQRSGDTSYRDAARSALDFLLGMQYPSGGFPQVYPARTGTTYSNYVTFNDDAMVRVLILLHQIVLSAPPLDAELFTESQIETAGLAISAGVDYILSAQILQDGVKTVWCAQHDPVTHEPRGARSYELPSKSGLESVGVASFLMTQPQTPEIESAVKAAIAWYASSDVQFQDTAYVVRRASSTDDSYNPIQPQSGSTMWCRFYDLDADRCFFSGRLPTDNPPGTGKQYDIMDIEPERRYGYNWGGSWGTSLLDYAASIGY